MNIRTVSQNPATVVLIDQEEPIRVHNQGPTIAVVLNPHILTYWEIQPGESFDMKFFPDRVLIAGNVELEVMPI